MKPLGKPQYKNPRVQEAAKRVQFGKATVAELQTLRRSLKGEDALLVGGLIEAIKVLEGL